MVETLAIWLFGWTTILAALTLSLIGLVRRQGVFLMASAVMVLPFAWYLSATPLFRYTGLVLPLFQLGAAYALSRRINWAAWLLVLPFAGVVSWLALSVITQGLG